MGSAMDLFSTVMTLVGGDAESATDGLDLSPVLGARKSAHEMPTIVGRALRLSQGPLEAALYYRGAYGLAPAKRSRCPQLFHLQRDPAERLM